MRWFSLLWPRGDRHIVLLYGLLLLFGLAMLWSVTEPLRGEQYSEMQVDVPKSIFWRQVLLAIVSWFLVCFVSRLPLRYLEHVAWPGYIISLVLLLLVIALGPEVSGAKRWLGFGPFRLQPSEFAKLMLVILLAAWLTKRLEDRSRIPATLGSLLLALVPAILVLRQPDLGTSLVFLAIWLGMLFWFGISGLFWAAFLSSIASAVIMLYSDPVLDQAAWPWAIYIMLLLGVLYVLKRRMSTSVLILACNVTAGLSIPLIWSRMPGYQQERILTFFDPSRDAWGSGYQAIQSKVAIGSGGLFGTQYLQGTQKGLAFLPARHTDFIFSVTGEELGLVGAVALLLLFFLLVMRSVAFAYTIRRPFGSLLAIGVASYFAFHTVVNISITTGLLPVTGLPLPLISYGGSSLLVSSLMIALALNLSVHRYDD